MLTGCTHIIYSLSAIIRKYSSLLLVKLQNIEVRAASSTVGSSTVGSSTSLVLEARSCYVEVPLEQS